jgi:hypothetical protein
MPDAPRLLKDGYHPAVRADLRREIERWFQRRGVPQLVAGYTSERQLDTRAAPLIIGWLVLGTVVYWGVHPYRPTTANAVGIVGVLGFVAAAWLAQRWLRGRRRWAPGMRLDAIDVFVIGPLIGVAAGVVDGDVREGVVAGLNVMLGIGVIYIAVGLGLVEIGVWSLGRLQGELFRIVGLLSRTLPVLLILVLFLLFAAEIWEAARGLSGAELAAILLLIAAIAVTIVLTGVRSELVTMPPPDWASIVQQAAGTPAAPLAAEPPDHAQPIPSLSFLQRVNVTAVLVIGQLINSTFVALLVMAFLVVFGLIALPGELQETWMGAAPRRLVDFRMLGETRMLSFELVAVTGILGAVVGLYFTGLAVNDAAYRPAHFGRLVDEVRPLVAARALYRSRISGQRP